MQVKTSFTDTDTGGVWALYENDAGEAIEFKIARAGNPAYLRAVDKHEAPHRKQKQRGKLSSSKEIELTCKAMAEGILMDWRPVEGKGKGRVTEGGEPLEYSQENAVLVLRYNAGIRDFVLDFALEEENYRTEGIEKKAKKSETT